MEIQPITQSLKKVWKLKTSLNEQQNKEFAASMSKEDHDTILDLDLDLSEDVLEEDTITSFVVCNELNLEKLKSILKKNKVEFTVDDTTDFFVSDRVSIDELSDEYIYEKLGA